MARLFGTDGVRGIANDELTYGMAFAIGQMAVDLLGPRLIIGRDTRTSGPLFETALAAGISSQGGTALLAGIIPTPAVALLARELGTSGGIVVSASHNPPEYNGIKLFDSQGFKLSKELENAFEERLQRYVESCSGDKSMDLAALTSGSGTEVMTCDFETATHSTDTETAGLETEIAGSRVQLEQPTELYIEYAAQTVRKQGLDLTGLTIAVDTGYGASGLTTPEALRRLGATVIAINTDFVGEKINVNCGSTSLGPLKALVAESGADAGIAHDGDADRTLAIDAQGNDIDGDIIQAIIALDLMARGALPHNTVVSTVMSNFGFMKAMADRGIKVIQTDVGDNNVLAAMREGGYVIGGEQSGHTILLEHNNTGDGLITALQLLTTMKRSGKTLAELSSIMTRFPQTLINVRVKDRENLSASKPVTRAFEEANARLSDNGRVLLRPSGTESVIRVMVEAKDEQLAHSEAAQLAAIVEQELGLDSDS